MPLSLLRRVRLAGSLDLDHGLAGAPLSLGHRVEDARDMAAAAPPGDFFCGSGQYGRRRRRGVNGRKGENTYGSWDRFSSCTSLRLGWMCLLWRLSVGVGRERDSGLDFV